MRRPVKKPIKRPGWRLVEQARACRCKGQARIRCCGERRNYRHFFAFFSTRNSQRKKSGLPPKEVRTVSERPPWESLRYYEHLKPWRLATGRRSESWSHVCPARGCVPRRLATCEMEPWMSRALSAIVLCIRCTWQRGATVCATFSIRWKPRGGGRTVADDTSMQ